MAHSTNENPVEWPARAVVTAGMPYGNKPLHFGHVGACSSPADAFARFLRDRIGKDNVRFVSGTDCFAPRSTRAIESSSRRGSSTGASPTT